MAPIWLHLVARAFLGAAEKWPDFGSGTHRKIDPKTIPNATDGTNADRAGAADSRERPSLDKSGQAA